MRNYHSLHLKYEQLVTFAFTFFKLSFFHTELNISVQNQQNLDYMRKTYKNKHGRGIHPITHVLYVFKTNPQLNIVQGYFSPL